MIFGQPTWVSDLLGHVQKRLAETIGIDSAAVFESLAPDELHCQFPPADRFVTITPVAFPADLAAFAGAGRYTIAFDGRLRVACLCRFATDQEFRSTRELRDLTRTALQLQLNVLNSLSGWFPTTTDNTASYLKEPMRCERFDVKPKTIRDTTWGVLESFWQVRFVAGLPSGNF